MTKKKEQFKMLLEQLGYDTAAAETMAAQFVNGDDATELPIGEIVQKTQEHFKPLLKREMSQEFKEQYMGEALNKIIAASKGKIRKANYEDGNIERALADLVSAAEQGGEYSEEVATINELRRQIEEMVRDKEESIQQLWNEFAEKENGRKVYDSLFSKLGNIQGEGSGKAGRPLSVDQQHAAKTILRELNEDYVLRFDEEGKDVLVYSKTRPEERASEGQKLVNINELIEKALQRNNWLAQSRGSGTINAEVNPKKVAKAHLGSPFRRNLEHRLAQPDGNI